MMVLRALLLLMLSVAPAGAWTHGRQFTLVLNYEASALAAPALFRQRMQEAANILMATILDNMTVTLLIGYDDYNNGQITGLGSGAVAADLRGHVQLYSDLRTTLIANSSSTVDASFVAALPAGSSLQGTSLFYIPSAAEKALGFVSSTLAGNDGAVGIGSSVPDGALVGVALHEMRQALGGEPGVTPFILGRFSSVGVRLFTNPNPPVAASYFSVDGGTTKLADYGETSDPADFKGDGTPLTVNDPFNELYFNGSTLQTLTTADKKQLDIQGFRIAY